jgi:hypothetical protein
MDWIRALPWRIAAHLFLLIGRLVDGRREP